MAAFSRLQLAKALIEYDNDPSNPNLTQKNADQSAIFAHMRRTLPSRQMAQSTASIARRSTDYLGVALPNDGGSSDSISQHRKSQASIDALRNPFGRDSTHEGHVDDEEMEVDLSSWGLDAFAPKEKGPRKKKEREDSLPNPHPLSVRRNKPVANSRTMSMGNLDQFGAGGAFLDAPSSLGPAGRRYSVGSPLDYAGVKPTDPSLRQRRASSGHDLIDSIPTTPPLHAVQFPSSEVPPLDDEAYSGVRPSSRASLLDPARGRTLSTASMGMSAAAEDESNPFALRPPSPDRASRFDPKYIRSRTMSQGTMATHMMLNDIDAESGRDREMPPDTASTRPRSRPYSRLELMRPKVLIMPSPLQDSEPQAQPVTPRDGFQFNTVDGPPLPAEARTGRRNSMTMSLMEPSSSLSPSTSYGLTPNPRSNMTLSQLTFRNTLMIDGQRDVTYADIDDHLRRATEDGEQVDWNEVEQQPTGITEEPIAPTVPPADDPFTHGRSAGKLYGTSLIDRLQARKAEMKGKQRVFRGDDRPSMMARTPMKRSSTLIDPESLKQRPTSTRFDSSPDIQGLARKNSASHRKTLLNFDDEIPGVPRGIHLGVDHPLGGSGGQTRSVFGVDTVWERELAKLREIEAREKEEEERQRADALDGPAGKSKKGKSKRKGKERERETTNVSTPSMGLSPVGTPGPEAMQTPPLEQEPEQKEPSPVARRALRRPPPPPADGQDDEEEEESDSSSVGGHQPAVDREENGWHSDSDDGRRRQAPPPKNTDLDLSLRLPDDLGPRRTTGSGPRYPNLPPRLLALQSQGQLQLDDDDDSEEDLPLVATIGRAAQRATRIADDESSDEDRPLTTLIDKAKTRSVSLGGGSLFGGSGPKSPSIAGSFGPPKIKKDDDEDDQPLGLRVSRMMTGSQHLGSVVSGGGNGDDDDKPLGLRPEQMRRSQMFAVAQQQQQQQQQMMMQVQAQAQAQAALHQSMIFGAPSIMSAPFYGPQMAPPMMMTPQLPSTPPPLPDTAKLNRVDKWRHDVAVEGET
ncbi:hypothetical protein EIP86_004808 [Pleurotus ostreatoroseus]|nr:hypothetical protein EIP86_004808 [Pleurotus ostreatoroseus]